MKKAILIGINYTGLNCELKGCINDIVKVSALLKDTYKYDSFDIMTDETPKKPTKQNIMESLAAHVASLTSADTLLFYYSGHGTQVRDVDVDEEDRLDEALVSLDKQAITDDELRGIMQNCKAKLYMFFDCCHSGTMCDLEYNFRPLCEKNNYKLWTEPTKALQESNIVTISGCLDTQTSADAQFTRTNGECANGEFENNGALTHFLLSILQGQNDIKIRSLLNELYKRLRESGFEQIPQFSCSKLGLLESSLIS